MRGPQDDRTREAREDLTAEVARAAILLAWRAAPVLLAVQLVAALAMGALPVTAAWLTKVLIDRISAGTGEGLAVLIEPAMGLLAAGVALAVLPQLALYATNELGRRVRLTVQDRLFSRVGSLPGMSKLEDPPFYDKLMIAQSAGTESPGRMVQTLLGVLQGGVTLAGFAVSLTVLSPALTAVVAAAAVPALVAELALGRRRARLVWSLGPSERRELFYADLLRDPQAAKEIRLFGIADFLRERMVGELRGINRAKRAMDLRTLRTQTGLAVLAAAVAGGGLMWAVRAAFAGDLTVGDVTMLVSAVGGTQSALRGLVQCVAGLHEALLVFRHYLDVVKTPDDLPRTVEARPVPTLRRGIEFRGVWFRYTEDQPWVLRGVDLFIPYGHAVALVGHNGAGKSTLVKLLCRFYDPTAGAILWDGVDIRDFAPDDLREHVSAVFQDYMCYDLTARENIGLGELSALEDAGRIGAAAGRAGVDKVLEKLPSGYETLLSRLFFADQEDRKSGVLLSGGQWQRVALARAFLRGERDLLILDEPSSGLDAEAEYEIHSGLRRHRQGRTSLLISHRLGALRDATAIAVLADGRITEYGPHQDLLAEDGLYARLFTRQSQGYRETSDDHEPDRQAIAKNRT